jgi:hypothetical protein
MLDTLEEAVLTIVFNAYIILLLFSFFHTGSQRYMMGSHVED